MGNPIKIIKNRSDIGAGTRGSDMGIDAIEIAAINIGSDYFDRYDYVDLDTENESIYNKVKNSFAKRIKSVFEQCERLKVKVKDTLENDYFPLIISGDHSSGLGTISGIKSAYPNKRLGVIWIDAHADLHSPYTSPSGNIHGMPLAAALAEDNLDCQINEVSAETEKYWNAMKAGTGDRPKILAEDIVYFGVRDTEDPENRLIENLGIKNYMVHEIRYRGVETCINEALNKLSHCDHIYISFDVDSMDCDLVSYGTGTPVAKGFDQYEIIHIINHLIVSKKVVALEFVEVNPLLDTKGNKMAETAFVVLEAVTKTLEII